VDSKINAVQMKHPKRACIHCGAQCEWVVSDSFQFEMTCYCKMYIDSGRAMAGYQEMVTAGSNTIQIALTYSDCRVVNNYIKPGSAYGEVGTYIYALESKEYDNQVFLGSRSPVIKLDKLKKLTLMTSEEIHTWAKRILLFQ